MFIGFLREWCLENLLIIQPKMIYVFLFKFKYLKGLVVVGKGR